MANISDDSTDTRRPESTDDASAGTPAVEKNPSPTATQSAGSKIEALANCEFVIDNSLSKLEQAAEVLQPYFINPEVEPTKLSKVIQRAFRGAAIIYGGVIGQEWSGEILKKPVPEVQAHYSGAFQLPYRRLMESLAAYRGLTGTQPTGPMDLVGTLQALSDLRQFFVSDAEATDILKRIADRPGVQPSPDIPAFIEDLPSHMSASVQASVFTSSGRVEPARIGSVYGQNVHCAALEFAFGVANCCRHYDLSEPSAEKICDAMEALKARLVCEVGPFNELDESVLAQLDIESTLANRLPPTGGVQEIAKENASTLLEPVAKAASESTSGGPPRPKTGSGVTSESKNTIPTDKAKRKPKKSTQKGEGQAKLISALTAHHKYANGGCMNREPIGNNELANLAKVDKSTASGFFSKFFLGKDEEGSGHAKYKTHCVRNFSKVLNVLKRMNKDYAEEELYGDTPPNESQRAS